MPKIDPKLPVFTRGGTSVEIITTTGRKRDRPIVGYIGSNSEVTYWTQDGAYDITGFDTSLDLVQPCELWVNIYDSCTATFPTKDAALRATKQPIARIKVAYTPGQFD